MKAGTGLTAKPPARDIRASANGRTPKAGERAAHSPETPQASKSMPRPSLPVDWEAIERRAIAGEVLERLAEEYGIPSSTLRERASREKWLTPAALLKRSRQIAATRGKMATPASRAALKEKAALSLAQRAEMLGTHALGILEDSVLTRKKGFRLKTVRDPKTAVDVAWKVTGKDQAATSVSVTVNGLHALPGPLHTPSVIMDAETVDVKESNEGEDA